MKKYLIEKLKALHQLCVIRSAFDGFILTGFITFLFMWLLLVWC
jgi:hypothetical protein